MSIELTTEQRELLKELKHWWISNQRQIFVYSGRAGTGKTTMEMGLEPQDVKNYNEYRIDH